MPPKTISLWFDSVPIETQYPQLATGHKAEVVVIGGGIVGVLAAWHLTAAGKRVILLEKNTIASGDSSATTGFLSRVPDTSIAGLVEKYGTEFVRDLFAAAQAVQKELFEIIEADGGGQQCHFRRCNSYYGSYKNSDEDLEATADSLKKSGVAHRRVASDQEVPNAPLPFKDAISFELEGTCTIRALLSMLVKKMVAAGRCTVFENSEVVGIESSATDVTVKTHEGSVKAEKCIVATGQPLECMREVEPLVEWKISYVVAARFEKAPLSQDLFWDTLDPYFYYRMVDDHTMIVGGADIEAGKVAAQKPFEKIETFLKEKFSAAHTVTHRWSGSLFHTSDGLPYAFEHPHHNGRVYVAMGFGGNGLVMGAFSAKTVVESVLATSGAGVRLLALKRTNSAIATPKMTQSQGVDALHTAVREFIACAKVSEFASRKSLCKTLNGIKIALFKVGDEYCAVNNTCSHAGGSLADGFVDGGVVECPLHGARFDVRTGAVVGLPATRPQERYRVEVRGEEVFVEVPSAAAPVSPESTKLASSFKKPTYWRQLGLFALGVLIFFGLEFAVQYMWLAQGDIGSSLIRSSALAGATLISCALLSSAIFRFFPRTASLWRLRRYAGVSGFILIALHVFFVLRYFFNWDIAAMYYSFNPLKNPIIFGSIAFPIFFVLAATSTDWAVTKLTPKVWKFIHRFVYVAYISSIFHFLRMNFDALKNPAGYLMLGITTLALAGEVYWYISTARKRGWRSAGTLIGLLIIVATIALALLVFTPPT